MKHLVTFSKVCKRQNECVVVILQTSQINLTFIVLGLFFLDNSVKNMARECTRDKSTDRSQAVRLLWISLPCT